MPTRLRVLVGIALALTVSPASAKERSPLESASVKAATDCVAAAALNNSNITTLYRQNRLKEVTDWIVLKSSACDNPLRSMRLLHDRIYGEGTGRTFLRGDYLADLPRAVRERISDEMEKRIALEAYASAPLPPRDTGPLSKGTELMVVNIGPNDVLNIREYATDNSRIIDIIPPNGRGVTYLGESQGQWIFIRYEDRAEGWVNRRFVQPIASRGKRLY
jgi:Bacterial SH3 domain